MDGKKPRWKHLGLYTSILIAAAIFVLDPLTIGFGLLAVFIFFIAAVVKFVSVLLPAKEPSDRWLRFLKAGVYFAACVLTVAFQLFNDYVAQRRAESIIAACEVYKKANGAYPDKLESLVPKYIEAIPNAKLALIGNNRFRYTASTDYHMFMYFPAGFARYSTYYLESPERKWRDAD